MPGIGLFDFHHEGIALHIHPESLRLVTDRFCRDRQQNSPGFTASVVVEGELAWSTASGLANLELRVPLQTNSAFHVASVSKQFTAVATGMLIRDGLVSLEDDVRQYVPELPNYGNIIRIRHLIHHTSGLRDDLWVQDFAGWRDDAWVSATDALDLIFRQQGLSFPTGSTFFYSNAGYSLLALIVERVSGIPFARFVTERLLLPLGMHGSRFASRPGEIVPNRAVGYSLTPEGEVRTLSPEVGMNGAIGLYTTVEDFALWFGFLAEETANDSVIGQLIQQNGTLDDGTTINYSLGFFTGDHRDHRTVRHGGSHGGYRAHMLYFPEEQLGIACFSNWSEFNPGEVCNALADAIQGHHVEAEESNASSPRGEGFDLQAGVWFEETWGAWLQIRENEGRLHLQDLMARVLKQEPTGGYSAARSGIGAHIFAAEGQDVSTLNVYVGASDETDVFRRVEVPALSTSDLRQYHGEYWSSELNALYALSQGPDEDSLLLSRRGHEPATLYPVGSDTFAHGFFVNQISLGFERDEAGAINGFALSSLRTRNIKFGRSAHTQDAPVLGEL